MIYRHHSQNASQSAKNTYLAADSNYLWVGTLGIIFAKNHSFTPTEGGYPEFAQEFVNLSLTADCYLATSSILFGFTDLFCVEFQKFWKFIANPSFKLSFEPR